MLDSAGRLWENPVKYSMASFLRIFSLQKPRMGFDGSDPARPLLAVAGGGDSLLSPDALPPETRAALRNGTANVAAALPPGVALLVPVELPALPPKKLREILPHLLAAKLPFPLSECLVRFDLPESGAGTSAMAHVVRLRDIQERLEVLQTAGCDPAHLIPPGPAVWLRAAATQPLPPETPRAVFFAGADKTLLASGHGNRLEAIAVFPTASAEREAVRRLRMSFAGLPAGLCLVLAGSRAAALADALRPALPDAASAIVPAPEGYLAEALASPAADAFDFRTGVAARAASERIWTRAAWAGALAFAAAAALALAAALFARSEAAAALEDARRERTAALTELAGRPISARGAAAAQMARAAAAAEQDPTLLLPDAAARTPVVLRAARENGIHLSHVRLDPEGLAASGQAPSREALDRFLAAVHAAGIAAAPDEAPRTEADGSLSFFVHAGGKLP